MPTGPPPRRETSVLSIVLISLLGLVVAGGVVYGATKVLGGDDTSTPPPANHVVPAGGDGQTSDDTGTTKPKATAKELRATATVAVLNGTTSEGLAGDMRDQLVNAGYTGDNVGADNDTRNQARPTSAVLYKRGASAQAKDVARVLGIDAAQVKPLDAETQAIAPDKSVVVEIGADKSGN
jgi:hypothetical protein